MAAKATQGIEGSGFNYGDAVTVDHLGTQETSGTIEAIHTGGKHVDVRIGHPGHKEHGRVVKFLAADVKPKNGKKESPAAE